MGTGTVRVSDLAGGFVDATVPVTVGASPQWPDETTTGPIDETLIPPTATGRVSTSHDGQILENFHAENLHINHKGVTCRNFKVTSDSPDRWYSVYFKPGVQDGQPRTVLMDGSIGGPVPSANTLINGSHFDAVRLNMWHGDDAAKGHHFTIDSCYIHDLIEYQHPVSGKTHPDGVQCLSTGSVIVRNSAIWIGAQQTSAVNIVPYSASIDDVLIVNNWLEGGAYTLYVRAQSGYPTPTNVRVLNNTFGGNYLYGNASTDGQGPPLLEWSGNVNLDGDPVEAP